MLHCLGGDSGQSHSLLAQLYGVVRWSTKWITIFSSLFLDGNFREAEEQGGGGQREVENILPPQREKLQSV